MNEWYGSESLDPSHRSEVFLFIIYFVYTVTNTVKPIIVWTRALNGNVKFRALAINGSPQIPWNGPHGPTAL